MADIRARTPRPPRVLLVVENVALARDHRLRKQAAALISDGYQVSVICRSEAAVIERRVIHPVPRAAPGWYKPHPADEEVRA